MATLIQNEVKVGGLSALGVAFLSAEDSKKRVLFNALSSTLSATVTVTYANTAGVSVSSGAGKLVFSTSYHNTPIYIYNSDRSAFASKLLSSASTLSLTAVPVGQVWGDTERRLRLLGNF